MSNNEKVKLTHLQRCAYLYVRQSTATQVGDNRESINRLYILAERAIRLDWSKPQVKISDEDLAQSGSGTAERSGFTMMTTEVALAHVGLILHLPLGLLDGTRSLIAAVWTDLSRGHAQHLSSEGGQSAPATLGSLSHLLHARKVVDALLCKLHSSEQVHRRTSKEESQRATATGPLASTEETASGDEHLGRLRPPEAESCHSRTSQADQQGGLSG